ncbi:MAG TPA: PPOX class F420-dependent oxidoreductase [Acidimicrobiia bacterium]|nr:PPOX class F420-dependent oxidoreductase [Acidimicrobiia bacterium]
MDVDEALAFVREHHHAVLATVRADGRPQLTPVTCGVDRDGMVVVSTRQTAMKTKNVRRETWCSLCVFTDAFYGPFVQIEGTAELVELPDAMEHLVEYYRSVAGEHPDWDDYRAAMERDRRVMLRVRPERVGPNRSG